MTQGKQQCDPNDQNSYFCCGRLDVMMGAKIMAIISLLVITLNLILSTIELSSGHIGWLIAYVILSLLGYAAVVLLWYGLKTDRKGFILHCLICTGVILVLLIYYTSVGLYLVMVGYKVSNDFKSFLEDADVTKKIFKALQLSVMLATASVFFFVAKKSYAFVKQNERFYGDARPKQFNPNDRKYFYCCGRLHNLTGAKIAAGINALLHTVGLIATITLQCVNGGSTPIFIGTVVAILISFALVLMLWYGLISERKGFLIPSMVYSIVFLVALSLLSSIKLYDLIIQFTGGYKMGLYKRKPFKIAVGKQIGFFAAIGLAMWYYFIVKKAYSYIKHKRFAKDTVVAEEMQEMVMGVSKEDGASPAYDDELAVRVNLGQKSTY